MNKAYYVSHLKKVNVIFLALILLMGLATLAFGQQKNEIQQEAGDSSLVDIDVQFLRDSAAVVIYYDEDVTEIVSMAYPTIDAYDSTCRVEGARTFSPDEVSTVTFYPVNKVFIKTKRGVTSLYYIYISPLNTGLLFLNGKYYAEYRFDDKKLAVDKALGELLNKDLDREVWAYGTSR